MEGGRQTTDAVNRVIELAIIANACLWKYAKICAVVTLEVKNAFDCATWDQILIVLQRRGVDKSLFLILKSYLSERKIIVEADGKMKTLEEHRVVPQSSILGPILLKLNLQEE